MRRREFFTLLGATAATWPLVRAKRNSRRYRRSDSQQPIVRWLLRAVARISRQGLKEPVFVEGENLTVRNIAGLRTARNSRPDARGRSGSPSRRCNRRDGDRFGTGGEGGLARQSRSSSTSAKIRSGMVGRQPRRPGGNLTGVNLFHHRVGGQSGWRCCANSCPGATRVAVLVIPVTPRSRRGPA
jgi:hypothetical protein